MMKMKKKNPQLAKSFNRSARYIDDLITLNNDGLMKKFMNEIYPTELELKHENAQNDTHATYLDMNIDIVDHAIVTSVYDKRDDFPFKIVNFPDLSGNIPHDASYGVFIAQTLRYVKACTKYHDFVARTHRLIDHLTNQSFNRKNLLKKLIKWTKTSPKARAMNKFGHSMKRIWTDIARRNTKKSQ